MNQNYEKLEIEVIEFETDDIVVCSDPRYPGEEDQIGSSGSYKPRKSGEEEV